MGVTEGGAKTSRGLFRLKHCSGSGTPTVGPSGPFLALAVGGAEEEAQSQSQAWLSVKSHPALLDPAESLGSLQRPWNFTEGGGVSSGPQPCADPAETSRMPGNTKEQERLAPAPWLPGDG